MLTKGSSIVFLKFDGVLHPKGAGTFEHLPFFEKFLRKNPSICVVITDPSRATQSLMEWSSLFSEDLRSRVVGVTPGIPVDSSAKREAEIRQWMLTHNAYGLHWAALDDDATLYAPCCRELVRCDPRKGLCAENIADVQRLLHP